MANTNLTPAAHLVDGRTMPIVGLGTWQMHGDSVYTAVRHALDVGYRHIDTATMYGNETDVGRAVRDSHVPREDLFITTKLPPGNAGRERATITNSLRALGVDYVDLWLVHWPPNGTAAPVTWSEFILARDDGLARSIGVSNYSVAQIDELRAATDVTPVVNQIRWSPPLFDANLLVEHRRRQVVVEGYSPLRAGNLKDPVLVRIAESHGVTPAQVVLRWHIEHGIVVIPKSATPERVASNFDVFGFTLSTGEIAQIDAIGRNT